MYRVWKSFLHVLNRAWRVSHPEADRIACLLHARTGGMKFEEERSVRPLSDAVFWRRVYTASVLSDAVYLPRRKWLRDSINANKDLERLRKLRAVGSWIPHPLLPYGHIIPFVPELVTSPFRKWAQVQVEFLLHRAVTAGMYFNPKMISFHVGRVSYAVAEDEDTMYVAYHGTRRGYLRDLLVDIMLWPIRPKELRSLSRKGMVHYGFWRRSRLYPQLKEIHDVARSNGKLLVVCGHSLGGAVASLKTFQLLASGSGQSASCITFGQPQALSVRFVEDVRNLRKRFFVFQDENDGICRLLGRRCFQFLRLRHFGEIAEVAGHDEEKNMVDLVGKRRSRIRFFHINPFSLRLVHHHSTAYTLAARKYLSATENRNTDYSEIVPPPINISYSRFNARGKRSLSVKRMILAICAGTAVVTWSVMRRAIRNGR